MKVKWEKHGVILHTCFSTVNAILDTSKYRMWIEQSVFRVCCLNRLSEDLHVLLADADVPRI